MHTNALADECVSTLTKHDPSRPITGAMVLEAKERLIQSRTTHLDALAERLEQPEVKRVVQTIMAGATDPELGVEHRGVQLCLDLGLIAWSSREGFTIANPLYREVLPRVLNSGYQHGMAPPEFRWQTPSGGLDMDALLREFQCFWREHSDAWESKADYPEVFPHLLLMAFLQRVLNGGGSITREYAAGRGRMDLLVEFDGQRFIIEIKLVLAATGRATTLDEALKQVARYRSTVGSPETPTFVVLFDRTPAGRELPWDAPLTWNTLDTDGGSVTVVGG